MPEARTSLWRQEPLSLEDPALRVRIERGEVGVFALERGVEAPRVPLFTLGPGEVLFGCPGANGSSPILAVPLGDVELLPLAQGGADAMAEAAAAALGWSAHLAGLAAVEAPLDQVELAHGRATLESGASARLPAGGWIQLLSGSVRWMGDPEALVTPVQRLLPLGDGAWLQAIAPTELLIVPPGSLATPEQLEAGLRAIASLARPFVRERLRAGRIEAADRITAWLDSEANALDAANRDLASILAPAEAPIPGGDPLLASLRVIGQHMGIEFRKPSSIGGKRDPVRAIAHASHVRIRAVRLGGDWWRRDNGPLLVRHREDRRPIALLPQGGRGYRYVDPTRGDRGPVDAALARHLRGAVMFYQGFPEQVLAPRDILQFTWRLIRTDGEVVVAVALLSAMLGIVIPQATYWLLTTVIPDGDRALLWQLGIAMFVISAMLPVLRLVQDFAVLRAEVRAESTLEAAVWDRVLGMRLPFFRETSPAEVIKRMGMLPKLRKMLAGSTLQGLVSGVFSTVILAQLFFFSAPMALVALAIGIVIVTYASVAAKLVVRERIRVSVPAADTQAQVVDMIEGLAKIRVAKAESRAFAHVVRSYALKEREDYLVQDFENRTSVFGEVVPILSTALLYGGFAAQAEGGSAAQMGAFIAFSAAFSGFLAGCLGLGNALAAWTYSQHLWRKLMSLLNAPLETRRNGIDPGPLSGAISLKRLSFRYGVESPYVLRDLSCEIAPGELVAIAGASGSGKSTLLRILLGFEATESGKLYLDGNDVAGLDLQAVRRQIGAVLQHDRISKGTLYEAIACGRPFSYAEVRAAAEAAGMGPELDSMPMGLYTAISEGGSNLSAGQRQRIFIARALASSPRILVFDEAMSNLDARTQEHIIASLKRLSCTRIVVTKRLNTLRQADRVLMLDGGTIAQEGHLDDLIREPGLLAAMIQRQFA